VNFQLNETLAHLFQPRRSNNHRPRVLQPKALFFLGLIMLGLVGVMREGMMIGQRYGQVLGFASSITPLQVVEVTNQERDKVGLLPLSLNSELSAAALAKGQDMFSDQYWSHIAPDGTTPWDFMSDVGYTYQVAGENLARDFSDTDGMVKAWMNSPTHKANIVNDRYTEIGVAVIDGTMKGVETTLVVQMFGHPQLNSISGVVPEEENKNTITVSENNVDVLTANQEQVLSSVLVPSGQLEVPPLFSPLQLTKALSLALILMIITTLVYDGMIIGHRETVRLVGKNSAHIILLLGVAFLVIFFKGGIVG
jgi:hypothetical protein